VFVIDEFLKMDINNGRMLNILSQQQIANAGPIQFVALKVFERLVEINQRLVQGVGINWSMLDQFHREDYSLRESLHINSEKALTDLKQRNLYEFKACFKPLNNKKVDDKLVESI